MLTVLAISSVERENRGDGRSIENRGEKVGGGLSKEIRQSVRPLGV